MGEAASNETAFPALAPPTEATTLECPGLARSQVSLGELWDTQTPGLQPHTVRFAGSGTGPRNLYSCSTLGGPKGRQVWGLLTHPTFMVLAEGTDTCPRAGKARLWWPKTVWAVSPPGEM